MSFSCNTYRFPLVSLALDWLYSFLQDRSLMVAHDQVPVGLCSNWTAQDSVLGRILYIIYTANLGSLLTVVDVLSQSYADHLQAYIHCMAVEADAAVGSMSWALQVWMSSNLLWLTWLRLS